MMRPILTGLLAMILGGGCRTSTPQKTSPTFIDSEDNTITMDYDASGEPGPNLWSPMRRKMNASYYFMVAEYEAMKNNIGVARKMYEDAYDLDPNAYVAWKMIAAEAGSGKLAEALLKSKRTILLYPKDANLHSLHGQLLAASGQTEDGISHLEKSIALAPQSPDAYLHLIRLYLSMKKMPEALAVANDLTKKLPDFADGWSTVAKIHISMGQKNKALKPAERAYELQSNDPEKILIYALALDLNNQSKKAVNLYEILFRMNPTSEELIARMVELYREIGDLNDALTLLNEAAESSKSASAGIRLQQAIVLWELKRYQEAEVILSDMAQKYPESDRLKYMSGLGKEKVGDLAGAITIYGGIPEASQYFPHGMFRSVNILREQKRHDEAMAIVRRMTKLKGETQADFFTLGGAVLDDAGRTREAIDFLVEGIKENSTVAGLVFMKGVYHEKLGQRKECIEAMREVIRKDPQHSSAYNYLGYLFAEAGENLEEAENLIKKALELKPDDAFYMDSLGWVYYQQGEYQKALDMLNKAHEKIPGEAVIMEHLGDVHLKLKDPKAARPYMEKMIKGNMEDRDRARIEKKHKEFMEQYGEKSSH